MILFSSLVWTWWALCLALPATTFALPSYGMIALHANESTVGWVALALASLRLGALVLPPDRPWRRWLRRGAALASAAAWGSIAGAIYGSVGLASTGVGIYALLAAFEACVAADPEGGNRSAWRGFAR